MLESLAGLAIWQILLFVLLPLSIVLSLPPYFIRKKYSFDEIKKNNQVAGFKFSMLGAIYAVLLAFIMLEAYRNYNMVSERVQNEAAAVSDIFRAVNGLQDSAKTAFRSHLDSYAREVTYKEWDMMKSGTDSKVAWKLFDSLWNEILKYEPHNPKEATFYNKVIDNMEQLGDLRRLRILSMGSMIPGFMWLVVFLGGMITLGFTYFFAGEKVNIQMWMTGIVSFCLMLFLTLIILMDNPFSSSIAIDADAYHEAIERMETVTQR